MLKYDDITKLFNTIQEEKPLVHHITTYVTATDSANTVLAFGGSPVMADDPNEVEEMVSYANSLVLNIGTLSERRLEAMIKAGRKANELNIPVCLDPVGVGATSFRKEAVKRIIEEVKLTVLKGNMSEIKSIYGLDAKTRGVDSTNHTIDGGVLIARKLALRLECVVAITGSVDVISDGKSVFCIHNGHVLLESVTGTGCMTSSLIGVCLGTGYKPLQCVLTGILTMSISGEHAYKQLKPDEGLGSYRVRLMDAISNITAQYLAGGRVDEIK
ncbi:hydroxyethylthiazole kinase [Haloplasma contractile]|uniref:hydroxyethylthiazole kinase n=1 Tax=Haloplasma contractile TaxID=471825 RepID=UPI0002122475|nr:hydroxyethylthiazole kinase [Haloplasma contractile]